MKYIKTFETFKLKLNEQNLEDKSILELIDDCTSSGWAGSNMEDSFSCITFDNDWYFKLKSEFGDNPEVVEIIKKIDDNTMDLWEDDLNETFECVITEDIYDSEDESEDDETATMVYNGWYEDLEKFFNK